MIILEIHILKIDVYVKMKIKSRLMLAALRMDLHRAGVPTNVRSSDLKERRLQLYKNFLVLSLRFSFLELGYFLISCCTKLGRRKHNVWIGW